MRSIIYLFMLLLLASCAPRKQLIKEVPIKETIEQGVVKVPIEQDSMTVRLVVDCLPNGQAVARQVSQSISPMQFAWSQSADTLDLRMNSPPHDALVPYRVIEREVPVQVEVQREINVIYWWQKILMWLGAISLLYILIKLIKLLYHGRTN